MIRREHQTTEQILAQVDRLNAEAAARHKTGCECGHSWPEHSQNPTTPDWLECGRCGKPCFND